jgi:hypothetical protein
MVIRRKTRKEKGYPRLLLGKKDRFYDSSSSDHKPFVHTHTHRENHLHKYTSFRQKRESRYMDVCMYETKTM